MNAKQVPPVRGGTDALTEMLRARHVTTDAPPPAAAPSAAPPAPERARPRSQGAGMDRRSWYMPKESADALAAAVEDLHWSTRQPKHVVLAALVAVALDHVDEARQRAGGPS